MCMDLLLMPARPFIESVMVNALVFDEGQYSSIGLQIASLQVKGNNIITS